MAQRAVWSGAITFGLVSVPVKAYTMANKAEEIRFNMLHDKDHARIHQNRVCSIDGKEVPFENIVKGYEVAKDQYVVVTPDELENFAPEQTQTIAIEHFVDGDTIDPVYYEAAYWLKPEKVGVHAYNLLLRAIERENKVGIAKVVMRTKESLCAVRVLETKNGSVLVMNLLHFGNEIVDPDVEPVKEPAEKEVEMASKLVEAMSGDFNPQQYTNEHNARLRAYIEQKARGEVVQPAPQKSVVKAQDMNAVLEASLVAARKNKKAVAEKIEEKVAEKPKFKKKEKKVA